MPSDDLLTLNQAAEVAGLSPATLRQAIARDALHATKYGTVWLVTRAELQRYLDARPPWFRKGRRFPAGNMKGAAE